MKAQYASIFHKNQYFGCLIFEFDRKLVFIHGNVIYKLRRIPSTFPSFYLFVVDILSLSVTDKREYNPCHEQISISQNQASNESC